MAIPAFPGAVGFGAESVGGRGGTVIHVTNLNDTGTGSFREALTASGARIIVFDVAGAIPGTSGTIIPTSGNVTIAGQTAPGTGITFQGRINFRSLSDVIMRYIRFRSNGELNNGLQIRCRRSAGTFNLIFDHCSWSWYEDDDCSVNNTDTGQGDGPIRNITFQNCFWGECPDGSNSEKSMLIGHVDDYGDDLEVIREITMYNCAFISSGERNPVVRARDFEFVNNLVYNYQNRIGEIAISRKPDESEGTTADFINNYNMRGVESSDRMYLYAPHDDIDADKDTPISSLYIPLGNVGVGLGTPLTATDDPWTATEPFVKYHGAWTGQGGQAGGGLLDTLHRRLTRLSKRPTYPIDIIRTADEAKQFILENCGANVRLEADGTFIDNRDNYDEEYINDFINDTGPNYPTSPFNQSITVDAGNAYVDSNNDGIADVWKAKFGLRDINATSTNPLSGYDWIEHFINADPPGVRRAGSLVRGRGRRGKIRARRDENLARWRKHVEEIEAKMFEDAEERSREVDFDVYLYPRRDNNGEDAT